MTLCCDVVLTNEFIASILMNYRTLLGEIPEQLIEGDSPHLPGSQSQTERTEGTSTQGTSSEGTSQEGTILIAGGGLSEPSAALCRHLSLSGGFPLSL